MSISLKLKVDIAPAMQLVRDTLPKAAPYVAATMLTGLAGAVQRKITAELPKAFDRPTPYTQRSVFTKGANKTNLQAEVYFPQSMEQQGRSKREYIRPGAQGTSSRAQKRSEVLLVRMGVLPSGWVTVPGKFAMANLLDGYGNLKGQYYRQIIRNLQLKQGERGPARGISKASQARATRMGVDNEFFAVTPGSNRLAKGGGWLPPGVYKREGKQGQTLRQYLKFVRKAAYRKRLDVETIARKEIAAQMNTEFNKAFGSVMQKFKANATQKAAAR